MDLDVSLQVIGIVRTAHTELATTPIQAGLNRAEHGTLEIADRYREGLDGLADFGYAWLLTWLHELAEPGNDPPLRQVPFLSGEALGEKVNDWFPFSRHLIQGLYRTARSIEATARQRESLITLGMFAAGFAHEINNPAAAASRAVDALDDACQTLLSSLTRLARDEISAGQFTALDTLRREIEPDVIAPESAGPGRP